MRLSVKSLWSAYQSSLQTRPLRTKTAAASIIFLAGDLAAQRIAWAKEEEEEPVSGVEADEASNSAPVAAPVAATLTPAFTLDARRAASGAAWGVLGTMYLHYWWNVLERFAASVYPVAAGAGAGAGGAGGQGGRRKLANVVLKVAIDQGLSAPLYCFGYYFVTNVIRPSDGDWGRMEARPGGGSGGGTKGSDLNSGIDGGEVGAAGAGAGGRRYTEELADRAWYAASHAVHMVPPTMLRGWTIWPLIHGLNFYFVPFHNRVLVQNLTLVVWCGFLSHWNHGGLSERGGETTTGTEETEVEAGGRPTTGAGTGEVEKNGRKPVLLLRRQSVITGLDVVQKEDTEDCKK